MVLKRRKMVKITNYTSIIICLKIFSIDRTEISAPLFGRLVQDGKTGLRLCARNGDFITEAGAEMGYHQARKRK